MELLQSATFSTLKYLSLMALLDLTLYCPHFHLKKNKFFFFAFHSGSKLLDETTKESDCLE